MTPRTTESTADPVTDPTDGPTELELWITKLNGLTVDELAALLRAEGVTGRCSHPYACPIAELLKRKCGGVPAVAPGETNDDAGLDPSREYEHSAALEQFIDRFDVGEFPDLHACDHT